MEKKLVYFLCTGNSCRSQMADGFLKTLGNGRYDVKSAGLEAHGLNPRAVQVMQEAGIDISRNTSDVIDPEILKEADFIITLCGHANDNCPIVRNDKAERWHWGFDDPAKAIGTEEEVVSAFREVRDAIQQRVELFVKEGK
ncbi:arsenate reductase (thioredoxin) [Paenibacillus cymbidii]|uniref:arsenate reductase (thioredoxin) n=1 Tax=Paenibacillus cymbidii TaxID=1639034 RepID=UPI001A9C0309|nr:arsenate reductase (thioredoxin) [Paenibacillus cymbidii]